MADTPFLNLTDKAGLQHLVDEGLEESLTLDYKGSPSLTRESPAINELCKDVSALANSAGGQLIYGIEEDKKEGKPKCVDAGVADPKVTREWIEQTLNSRVHPRMQGVRIERIELTTDRYGYVLTIPPTQTGPHQAPDKKYYKRFELQSMPMEDYEIRDVMRRSTTPDLFLLLDLDGGKSAQVVFPPGDENSHPVLFNFQIGNRAAQPATTAIITIGVDPALDMSNRGAYRPLGFYRDEDRDALNWFSLSISPTTSMPIFKEATQTLSDPPLSFTIQSRWIMNYNMHVKAKIQAPGFVGTQQWELRSQMATLSLREF